MANLLKQRQTPLWTVTLMSIFKKVQVTLVLEKKYTSLYEIMISLKSIINSNEFYSKSGLRWCQKRRPKSRLYMTTKTAWPPTLDAMPQTPLMLGDVGWANRTFEFCEQKEKKIEAVISKLESARNKVYDENLNVKPYRYQDLEVLNNHIEQMKSMLEKVRGPTNGIRHIVIELNQRFCPQAIAEADRRRMQKRREKQGRKHRVRHNLRLRRGVN